MPAISQPTDAAQNCTEVDANFDVTPPPFKPFQFLSLPGELRNRVYDFVVDQGPEPRQGDSVIVPTLHLEGQQIYCIQPLLALTQVCRLIRYEFQPIARAHTTTKVPIQLVRQFLAMQEYCKVPSSKDCTLVANIIADMRHDDDDYDDYDAWDVQYAILDLCNKYQSTNFNFTNLFYYNDYKPGVMVKINCLLKTLFTEKLSLWGGYLNGVFERIELVLLENHHLKLTFWCRDGYLSPESGYEKMEELLNTMEVGQEDISGCMIWFDMIEKSEGRMTEFRWDGSSDIIY